MVYLHIPQGGLFSLPNMSGTLAVPSICVSRAGLSVQGPAVWSFPYAEGVHQGSDGCSVTFPGGLSDRLGSSLGGQDGVGHVGAPVGTPHTSTC